MWRPLPLLLPAPALACLHASSFAPPLMLLLLMWADWWSQAGQQWILRWRAVMVVNQADTNNKRTCGLLAALLQRRRATAPWLVCMSSMEFASPILFIALSIFSLWLMLPKVVRGCCYRMVSQSASRPPCASACNGWPAWFLFLSPGGFYFFFAPFLLLLLKSIAWYVNAYRLQWRIILRFTR